MGVGAERALQTILGGEDQPSADERTTPQQMAAYLLSASSEAHSYDEGARLAGRIVLEYLQMHPEDAALPADDKHEWPNGWDAPSVIVAPGIHGQMERKEPGAIEKLRSLGLTGFMWGWAVNAAKYALDLPPVANPAIVTIDIP